MNGSDLSRRVATEGDGPFLRTLFDAVRGETFAGVPAEMREGLLLMQFEAQRSEYRARFPLAEIWIIEMAGEAVGNLVLARRREALRIVDVNVLPSHQNQGLGSAVIQSVIADAEVAGLGVELSVFEHNRARHLYRRLGFEEAGQDGMYIQMERRPPTTD